MLLMNAWNLLSYVCLVLMPWGVWTWPPNVMSLNNYFVCGFEVLIGPFLLTGCLIIIISLFPYAKNLEYSRKGLLLGELIVGFLSLLWIFGSCFLSWVWKIENGSLWLSSGLSGSYLAPTFGAFITCLSSLIVITLIIRCKTF